MRSAKVWQWITTFSNVVCKQNINLTNNKHLTKSTRLSPCCRQSTEICKSATDWSRGWCRGGDCTRQLCKCWPSIWTGVSRTHPGLLLWSPRRVRIKYLSLLIILSCLFSVGVGHSWLEKEDCRWLRTILTINWGHNNCLTSLLHWRLLPDCFGRRNIVTNNWKVWLGLVQSTNLTVPLIQSAIFIPT